MKAHRLYLTLLLVLGLPAFLPALAQQPMNRPCIAMQASMFDADSVATLTGTVERLELKSSPHFPSMYGVHLFLATDDGTVEVHLGPVWFLDNQDIQIQEGDAVTVIGADLVMDGMTGFVALQVQRGDDTLHLRDEAGRPLWRGSGRRQ